MPSTVTILILVLRATCATITALEHFPSDNALLPRMETLSLAVGVGFDEYVYTEVHPCARSFNAFLSSRYKMPTSEDDILRHTLHDCIAIESSAAWWSAELECVPLFKNRGGDKTPLFHPRLSDAQGQCFIFQPYENWKPSSFKVWQHPCEAGFSASVSQWYTNWDHTTYEKCKDKPNAGAWRVTRTHDGAGCFMFFGPQRAWPRPGAQNNNKLGQCFVLDKVPVFRSYVEVHPCDTHFRLEQSAFFSVIDPPRGSTSFTFAQCKDHLGAVAWSSQSYPPHTSDLECVPISKGATKQLVDPKGKETIEEGRGLCFKFNGDEAPDRSVLPERIRIPYLHVCESGFNAKISRWYSLSHLTDPTLEDCGREKNAAAWRAGRSSSAGCFVFYWNSNTRNVPDRHLPGQCYILDKVVPLGSLHPPPRIVTKLDLQHILFKG